MTVAEVCTALNVLAIRERLIAKLAIIAGRRPGEIFGLTWGRVEKTFARVEQRVYRGLIDTPKTHRSERSAAIAKMVRADLEAWKMQVVTTRPRSVGFSI